MSTLKRKSGGSWTDVADIRRRASGAWAPVSAIRRRVSGAWSLVWPAFTVSITDQSLSSSSVTSAASVCGYRLNTSGVAEKREGLGTYTTLETWLSAGDVSLLEARVTVLSGTLTSGTIDTWIAASTSPLWYIQDPDPSATSNFCEFLLEIRHADSGTVLDTATIQLTASYEP